MRDNEDQGFRISGNTVKVVAFLAVLAPMVAGGLSYCTSHGENTALRDATETRHRSVETEFATVTARLDAHQQLIERNASDVESLRKDLTQKYDRIEEQLQKILEALGRLNGRVGEGKGRESSAALTYLP